MKKVAVGIAGAIALCWAGVAPAQGDLHVLYPAPGLEQGFGWSVSGAGDVDGDGFPDVVVGAPQASTSGSMAGLVMVFSGQHAGVLHSLPGNSARDNLGWSVSDAGDVNGDGFADILAGAPCGYPDTSLGYARLYSGDSGATLQKWLAKSLHDGFGISVSGAGDINNDGFPDVLVGASMEDNNGLPDSGSVHVFSIQAGQLYRFDGQSAGGAFGSSVSDAGDVNNDGFPDIVVGAPMDESFSPVASGSVEVFSGKDGTSLYRFLDPVPGMGLPQALGCCVSDAGDVDADGYADVIVSGYCYMMFGVSISTSAAAFVVSGKSGTVIGGSSEIYSSGEHSRAVSGAGDIDGDGYGDALMQLRTPDGVEAWSGKHGWWLFNEYGGSANDLFGEALSDAGDVNGDGIPEIVVSAPSKTSTPYVRVISTRCGRILPVGQGCPGSAANTPKLDVTGCPVPGGSLLVVLDASSFSPAPALLFAGSATTSLPMGSGCSLLVAPPLTPFWTVTQPFGVLVLETRIPMDAPLATLAVQGFIPDPAAPAGFRNTNAVLIAVE
ncbi:MAG: FG-GAP repeat protein [Planctomycetes bacterium]|nr:FG-GAP repeat protein [Planctomycetota bacterium]